MIRLPLELLHFPDGADGEIAPPRPTSEELAAMPPALRALLEYVLVGAARRAPCGACGSGLCVCV